MRLRHKPWALPELREDAYFFENPSHMKGKWQEEFSNLNPTDLEIGCGKGDFLKETGKNNKDRNLIGLDLKNEVLVYAMRKVRDEDLSNVRVISMKAEDISDVFGENEIDTIYINFCNPWPKAGHNKRRLTHPRFLEKYRHFTKPGSRIEFKTDDEGLFTDSIEYFKENGWKITFMTDDLKADHPGNTVTEYEKRFRNFGMPIYRIDAVREERAEDRREVITENNTSPAKE